MKLCPRLGFTQPATHLEREAVLHGRFARMDQVVQRLDTGLETLR